MGESVSLGFVELGMSYLEAARHVQAGIDAGSLRLRLDHPVDLLLAHATELMLKGCLLEDDPSLDVQEYSHNLARLYDKARASAFGSPVIERAEKAVKESWRQRLRDARDSLEADLGLSREVAREFGALSNADIGAALDDLSLRKQIEWVSVRHDAGGSRFRYLEPRLDQRPQIKAFGLKDDVVRVSLTWGCEAIHSGFVAGCSQR